MKNPNGPYPGRQIFLGMTAQARPCFAYLVTGRSPESRQRKAVCKDNLWYMGPSGDAPYDALRHYTAVKYDESIGLLAVSNGIQTEAVYEMYRLLFNVDTPRSAEYLQKVMDGAESEPDSLNTPRIAGVIVPTADKSAMQYLAAIKSARRPAGVYEMQPQPGVIQGVSTYRGDLEKPEACQPDQPLSRLEITADSALSLADYIFEISAACYKESDIRVCALGGVFSAGKWDIAVRNTHQAVT